MKPRDDRIEVQGNLPGKTKRMAISKGAMTHIMRILIRLYTDRELAVLRELSTNARDSHIMARQTRPIEIQIPTPLSPYLIIRDFGLGLSEDEIYLLFGEYGESTKRDSDEVNGMLGLGSKAPLTYTNQFTMTATQNGVMAVVAITRDETGVGNLTTVSTLPTDEPNGVEIKIPAKRANSFQTKAQHFFRYWEPGTVLVNSKPPANFRDDAAKTIRITDDIYMLKGDHYTKHQSIVVMGNVPYPAPQLDSNALGLPVGYGVVAYVPMGKVEFVPAREGLEDTQHTRDGLEEIKTEFRKGLEAAIQTEIDQAPTALLAVKRVMNWAPVLRPNQQTGEFTWKGKKIPLVIEPPKKKTRTSWGSDAWEPLGRNLNVGRRIAHGRRGSRGWNQPVIGIEALTNCVFVTDFEPRDVSLTHHKKLVQWADRQVEEGALAPELVANGFILVDWNIDHLKPFLGPGQLVGWETIKAEKLPKVSSQTGRIPGSYDVVLGGKKLTGDRFKAGLPGDQIDQNYPVYYAHGNMRDVDYDYRRVLDYFEDHYTLICLPENRLAKFKRENPTIPRVEDSIRERAEKIAKSMSPNEKIALALYDSNYLNTFRALALYTEIKDPSVLRLIRIAKIDVKPIVAAREKFHGRVDFGSAKWDNPLKKYRLLPETRHSSNFGAHHIRYMNAEYDYLNRNKQDARRRYSSERGT